jgi:hypothetical protein
MERLSNFYTDYSSDYEQFEQLGKIYQGVADLILNYVRQVHNNTRISKIETYRTIPFQSTDVYEATYDLSALLSSVPVAKIFNATSLSLQERIDRWSNPLNLNAFDIERKIKALDMSGKYILLMAKRNEQIDSSNASIIDLEFYDNNNNALVRDVDFVLKNNKIYLFGNYAQRILGKIFIMKNIKVDFKTADDLLGRNVGMSYNNALTKNEYREMAQMLLYAAIGGPTINNIKNSIEAISGMQGVKVIDKYSNDPVRTSYWTANRANRLHEFDFLISLPTQYVENMAKMTLFIEYLKKIKPVYSNFFVSTMKSMNEIYILKNKDRRQLDVTLYAYEFLNNSEYMDLSGLVLTLSDILLKTEDVKFITRVPEIVERVRYKDNIDMNQYNFAFLTLQNNPIFDRILVRRESSNKKLHKLASDKADFPTSQTQWLCDHGNFMDDASYECDKFALINSEHSYFDSVSVRIIRNKVLNGGFTAGNSYWNLHKNAIIYPGKLVMDTTAAGQINYQLVNVIPNNVYILNVAQSSNANIQIKYYSNGTYLEDGLSVHGNSINNIFVTPPGCNKLKLILQGDSIGQIQEFYYVYINEHNSN